MLAEDRRVQGDGSRGYAARRREGVSELEAAVSGHQNRLCGCIVDRGQNALCERIAAGCRQVDLDLVSVPAPKYAAVLIDRGVCGQIRPEDTIAVIAVVVVDVVVVISAGIAQHVIRTRAHRGRIQRDRDRGNHCIRRGKGVFDTEYVPVPGRPDDRAFGLAVHHGYGVVRERITGGRRQVDLDHVLVSRLKYAAVLIDRGACGQILPDDVIAVTVVVQCMFIGGAIRELRLVVRMLTGHGWVQRDGSGGNGGFPKRREEECDPELACARYKGFCFLQVQFGSRSFGELKSRTRRQIDVHLVAVSDLEFAVQWVHPFTLGHIYPADIIEVTVAVVCVGVVGDVIQERRFAVRMLTGHGITQINVDRSNVRVQLREDVSDLELAVEYTHSCGLAVHRGCAVSRECITLLRRQIDDDLVPVSGLENAARRIYECTVGVIAPVNIIAESVAIVGDGVVLRAGRELRRVVRRRADGGRVQRN